MFLLVPYRSKLTPALTDFKGLTILSVIGGFLLLPIQKLKKNLSRDLRLSSVIDGFPLLAGTLNRDPLRWRGTSGNSLKMFVFKN